VSVGGSLQDWWPRVPPQTRAWLVEHNGESLPADVVAAIVTAGGVATPGAWWVGSAGPGGFSLSDAAVDWVEAVANGEAPPAPGGRPALPHRRPAAAD